MTEVRFSRRDVLRLGGAAAGAAILPTGLHAGAQEAELTFWNMIFPVTDPNNKTKKPEDFYIHQAIKRFEEANPGIKVTISDVPGAPESFTKYRTAGIAKNGPDLFATWPGRYMLDMKQFLEPLDPYFPQEERTRIFGWEAVTEGFIPGQGTTYGVPAGTDGVICFYTNTELLQKAGIDPEASWPQDFDGFLAMLDTIAASGTQPLVLSNQGYVWHLLDYWLAQHASTCLTHLCTQQWQALCRLNDAESGGPPGALALRHDGGTTPPRGDDAEAARDRPRLANVDGGGAVYGEIAFRAASASTTGPRSDPVGGMLMPLPIPRNTRVAPFSRREDRTWPLHRPLMSSSSGEGWPGRR